MIDIEERELWRTIDETELLANEAEHFRMKDGAFVRTLLISDAGGRLKYQYMTGLES